MHISSDLNTQIDIFVLEKTCQSQSSKFDHHVDLPSKFENLIFCFLSLLICNIFEVSAQLQDATLLFLQIFSNHP